MFVCEICDQELSEEEMSDFEDGLCRECAGDNDQSDVADDEADDACDKTDRDFPEDNYGGWDPEDFS